VKKIGKRWGYCKKKECQSVYQKKWRNKNPTKFKETQARYIKNVKNPSVRSLAKEHERKEQEKYPEKICKTSYCEVKFRGRLDYCPKCKNNIINFYAVI